MDAAVLGGVCFHIENVGMGGMGWDGKGRDVMGWEWGWGEVRHVEKVRKVKRLLPTNHPQASLWRPFGFCGAACGTLGAPVCAPFYHLEGAGAFLGQSTKKIRKSNDKLSQNGCQKDICLAYLSADVH